MQKVKGKLVLKDGGVYEGTLYGDHPAVGEVVFTTGMSGYQETLTDPSFCGQIVVFTYPLIGNYGIIPADFEGKCCVRGYVVREACPTPSNFRCAQTLDAFLKENNIPGIAGIDTRAVTRILREAGTMNAAICDAVPEELAPLRAYRITDPVPQVTTPESYTLRPEGGVLHRVALIDYGAKRNIARELCKRGCAVTVLPCSARAEDILTAGYDGVMLSNGPGDPAENVEIIANIREMLSTGIPTFGICLGHQLTALAAGAKTMKLKYGHRGANQPVTDFESGRTFITSQNHGYAVVGEELPAEMGEVAQVNANDGTCEGIKYKKWNCFTVQFHPEANGGPKDTEFLFDRFLNNVKAAKKEVR